MNSRDVERQERAIYRGFYNAMRQHYYDKKCDNLIGGIISFVIGVIILGIIIGIISSKN